MATAFNFKGETIKSDGPKVLQLIYTELKRAGSGNAEDPVRKVQQVFTLEGQLLVECDPYATLSIPDVLLVLAAKEIRDDPRSVAEMLLERMESKMKNERNDPTV